jgi:hypothetical protein
MIRRILNFDRQDWQHIGWLLGRILSGFWNGNAEQIVDAWRWLRLHLEYDSTRVN